MHFRPYPVLTLIAIPALAVLIGLGVWQLQRAEWKAGLIEEYKQALRQPPMAFEQAVCTYAEDADSAPALPMNNREATKAMWPGDRPVPDLKVVRVFGQDEQGAAGWMYFAAGSPPACIASEGAILTEIGWEWFVPGGSTHLHTREALPPAARYLPAKWPDKPQFALSNSPDANDWHWFDALAMAKALGVPAINTRFYLPVLSQGSVDRISRTPPETHYGYAVTWFGIAIAFVVIYALFHARAGRLRFGKQA